MHAQNRRILQQHTLLKTRPKDLNYHVGRCTRGRRSLNSIELRDFYNSKERRDLCTPKITGFYSNILHRKPDQRGLNYHVGRCTRGRRSLNLIEGDFYNIKERRDLCTRKVTGFYNNILYRQPDQKDLNFHVGRCTRGHRSLDLMELRDFYNSKERRDLCRRKITGFYNKLLHRAPDPLGLNVHIISCSVGRKSLSLLENAFFNSKERRNLCTSKITGFYVKYSTDNPTIKVSTTMLADAQQDIKLSPQLKMISSTAKSV